MTENSPETPFEEKEIRCPKLGGPVTFSYCRIETLGKPCSRAIQCWSTLFDVESFFRNTLSDEEYLAAFHTQPPSKVLTLIELIERAKKIADEKKKASE